MGQNEMSQDFSMQEDKSNDDEKNEKKQKILRNEFKTAGKYGIPLVKRQNIDTDKIAPWGYTKVKQDDVENRHKTIHFLPMIGYLNQCIQSPK